MKAKTTQNVKPLLLKTGTDAAMAGMKIWRKRESVKGGEAIEGGAAHAEEEESETS